MSASSTPSASPGSVQPLHNPKHAAQVVVPQAPLGNTTNGPLNQAPGMGVKALLAKKMAKGKNPKFISPTDNMMTPCTQKIGAAKKKHFTKGANPMQPLFAQKEVSDGSDDEADAAAASSAAHSSDEKMAAEDDNPF